MKHIKEYNSRLPGIYRLIPKERNQQICQLMNWPENYLAPYAPENGLDFAQADCMIENAVGVFGLPIGLAANFIVDEEAVLVPMAVEEPSIIAGISKAALLVAQAGGFHTTVDENLMMGQIQLLDILDAEKAVALINQESLNLVAEANHFCPTLLARGGGCREFKARILAADGPVKHEYDRPMVIAEFFVDCCDAMGANMVNTIAEKIAPSILALCSGRLGMKILSNLSDRRLASAKCSIPYALLAADHSKDFGKESAHKIAESYSFARRDPYRACTHNKGIMNGIDALAIATGNDWRALEAAAHAYAARSGQYSSLSQCVLDDEKAVMHLQLEVPIACGVVGGSTNAHPAIKKSLAILGSFAHTSRRLAGLMAAVGLAQNFAAVLALSSEGIQKGHMKLHAKKLRAHL